jgi:D-lactate dehydrogenase
VAVANVPGTDANTVAEHAFALILVLSRRLQEVREANKQPHFQYEQLRSFDLKDKTLGVIGTGRIGLRMAHIALAFGMKVLTCDPHSRSLMAEILGVEYVPIDALLQNSHVISLPVPLTPETHHLLNRDTLAKCRHGALVINTARGALIDTDALIEALDAGLVAGAGLDVLEEESVMQKQVSAIIAEGIITRLHDQATPEEVRMKHPNRIHDYSRLFRNQALLDRPNVVFTPHVAFNL